MAFLYSLTEESILQILLFEQNKICKSTQVDAHEFFISERKGGTFHFIRMIYECQRCSAAHWYTLAVEPQVL